MNCNSREQMSQMVKKAVWYFAWSIFYAVVPDVDVGENEWVNVLLICAIVNLNETTA